MTAAITSFFWIAAYSAAGSNKRSEASAASDGAVAVAGDKKNVQAGAARVTVAEGVVVGPTGLAIPVAGVKANQLADTFAQARAGGARVHDAIDIMAPHGTPVLAAAPGRVEKLYFSEGGGGISAYVRSPDNRWSYYYAHLLDYAPGLKEGQQVERGTLIGHVGSTGNASPDGPHLHFAIHRMSAGERWHQGSAINPYTLLAGKGR